MIDRRTGRLSIPVEEIEQIAINYQSEVIVPSEFIVEVDEKYIVFRSGHVSAMPRKIFKFPFPLTQQDKNIINQLLIQVDEAYKRKNEWFEVRNMTTDVLFDVIYNKVLDARELQAPQGLAVPDIEARRRALVQRIELEPNQEKVAGLQLEYNGLRGGRKTRKRHKIHLVK